MSAVLGPVRPVRHPVRRLPAFWLTLGLLALGLFVIGGLFASVLAEFPVAGTTAIVLFTLHGLVFVLIIRSLDYLEPEPPLLLATALAWGALVATSLALIANQFVDLSLVKLAPPDFVANWSAALSAPIAEEGLKALGIVMIILLAGHHINSVMDGMIYGAFVGLGFDEIENMVYAFNALAAADAGDTTGPVVSTFVVRGLLVGLWSHPIYTAITGAGIAWAVLHRDKRWPVRIGVALSAFVAAWALHFLWNSPLLQNPLPGAAGLLAGLLLKGAIILGFFVIIARLAQRHEAGFYAQVLRGLADPTIATEGEITALGSVGGRFAARWDAYVRGGFAAQRAVRRLQRGQAGLTVELAGGTPLQRPAGTVAVRPGRVRPEAHAKGAPGRYAEIRAARQTLIAAWCPEAVSRPGRRWGTVAGWTAIILGPAAIIVYFMVVTDPVVGFVLPFVPLLLVLLLVARGVRRARRTDRPADVRLGIGLLLAIATTALTLVITGAELLGAG